MAKSTGIILVAGGISYANGWIEDPAHPLGNLKIPVATLGVALIFAGLEKLNQQAAVGLAWIVMVTVLVTPSGGAKHAPLQNLGLVAKGK